MEKINGKALGVCVSLVGHVVFLTAPVALRTHQLIRTNPLKIHLRASVPDIKKIADTRRIVPQENEYPPAEDQDTLPLPAEAGSQPRPQDAVCGVDRVPQTVHAPPQEEEAVLRYHEMVKRKIQEQRRYPEIAFRKGFEGAVGVSFIVERSGAVREVNLLQASGYTVLDREALATVKRGAPFPEFGEYISSDSLQMYVDIHFLRQD